MPRVLGCAADGCALPRRKSELLCISGGGVRKKMFRACTALPLKGNVIQSAEGEGSRGHMLYAQHERAARSHNVHLFLKYDNQKACVLICLLMTRKLSFNGRDASGIQNLL